MWCWSLPRCACSVVGRRLRSRQHSPSRPSRPTRPPRRPLRRGRPLRPRRRASASTAAGPAAASATPLTRIITAVDGTTAWRATTGSCLASGAALSFTSNGGRTWQNAKTPYPVVTRVQPTDAARAFVVGGDPNCVMGVRTTVDSGTTWTGTGPGNLSETLARDTKDPTKVRAPGGRTVAPCGTLTVDRPRPELGHGGAGPVRRRVHPRHDRRRPHLAAKPARCRGRSPSTAASSAAP